MTLYEKILELHDMLQAGEIEDACEIDQLDDTFDAARFIKDMYEHLSETDEMAEEELTERQIATIEQLYEGYCNGDWKSFEEYL